MRRRFGFSPTLLSRTSKNPSPTHLPGSFAHGTRPVGRSMKAAEAPSIGRVAHLAVGWGRSRVANFSEPCTGEVRRITLPRTRVNKTGMPLSTHLPPLVATKIILLSDVPIRTKPYFPPLEANKTFLLSDCQIPKNPSPALTAGERCKRRAPPREGDRA